MNLAYFLISLVLLGFVSSPQKPLAPKTPSEAYERATEPLREWSKSKNQTLETNIDANKEQERLAKEYLNLFKVEDWHDQQLFNLGQLYLVALLPEETERAFNAYLRDPSASEITRARRDLLWALGAQKKWDQAIQVADELLKDPKYDFDINLYMQFVINGLRVADLSKAITLSEHRLPKLFTLAQSQASNPRLATTLLENAFELGALYRDSGNMVRAEEFTSKFVAQFQQSSLAANEKIKRSVEASILRIRLPGAQAPAIEGSVFVDMPTTSLGDLKGKVILLDFLAHWCAPCIVSFPALDAMQKTYGDKGLVIIGVTQYYGFFGEREQTSEAEELVALKALKLERNAKLGFIIGPPSNFASYGVVGLPAYALIDRAGKVRTIKTGGGVGEDLEKTVRNLISESVPAP